MSQPNLESASTPSVLSKKPQLNVYTVMLIVSLISLLLACLFLYLELREYGGWGAVKGRIGAISAPIGDLAPTLWA
jgi:hypothetical protein